MKAVQVVTGRVKPVFKTVAMALTLLLLAFFNSTNAFAELKELDDKKLEDMKGQAGITIDLEFKLEIGQIAWIFNSDGSLNQKKNHMPEPLPPRIDYQYPGKK